MCLGRPRLLLASSREHWLNSCRICTFCGSPFKCPLKNTLYYCTVLQMQQFIVETAPPPDSPPTWGKDTSDWFRWDLRSKWGETVLKPLSSAISVGSNKKVVFYLKNIYFPLYLFLATLLSPHQSFCSLLQNCSWSKQLSGVDGSQAQQQNGNILCVCFSFSASIAKKGATEKKKETVGLERHDWLSAVTVSLEIGKRKVKAGNETSVTLTMWTNSVKMIDI